MAVLRLYKHVAMTRRELRLSRRQAHELIERGLAVKDTYDNLTITDKGRRTAEPIINQD